MIPLSLLLLSWLCSVGEEWRQVAGVVVIEPGMSVGDLFREMGQSGKRVIYLQTPSSPLFSVCYYNSFWGKNYRHFPFHRLYRQGEMDFANILCLPSSDDLEDGTGRLVTLALENGVAKRKGNIMVNVEDYGSARNVGFIFLFEDENEPVSSYWPMIVSASRISRNQVQFRLGYFPEGGGWIEDDSRFYEGGSAALEYLPENRFEPPYLHLPGCRKEAEPGRGRRAGSEAVLAVK